METRQHGAFETGASDGIHASVPGVLPRVRGHVQIGERLPYWLTDPGPWVNARAIPHAVVIPCHEARGDTFPSALSD
jgi:hypothetical protein